MGHEEPGADGAAEAHGILAEIEIEGVFVGEACALVELDGVACFLLDGLMGDVSWMTYPLEQRRRRLV